MHPDTNPLLSRRKTYSQDVARDWPTDVEGYVEWANRFLNRDAYRVATTVIGDKRLKTVEPTRIDQIARS